MKKHYIIENSITRINDFSNAKKFASFLPMIAGEDGKPLWLYYVNEGQCVASFGVNDKDTPLLPFYSAVQAYQNTSLKCFRTIVYIGNKIVQPFIDKGETSLIIERSKITINFENTLLKMSVTFSTLSHKAYPGLIRKVSIVNKSNEKIDYIIDGLATYLPVGLDNYSFIALTTLASAYCKCDVSNTMPYLEYTNKGGDNSVYVTNDSLSGFFTKFKDKRQVRYIVDKDIVFKNESLTEIHKKSEVLRLFSSQITSNKIPCAFSLIDAELNKNEAIKFISVYSAFDNKKAAKKAFDELTFDELDKQIESTAEVVESLLPNIKTNNPVLDEYVKQSFLDNYLRGGYPKIINDKLCYLYSRKHGDLERDYNAFVVPNSYFSSGLGNYRDLNQNRRNDLLFEPRVKDYNIYLFFSLIENNGFNPLVVNASILDKKYETYEEALDALNKKDNLDIKADYKEGYWIDHWAYNIDLLENYLSVYPDKVNDLLNEKKYHFFDSNIRIRPRSERYVETPLGVRQYHSLEKLNNSSNWLMNDNQPVTINLASKIFDLILKKYVTLDVDQMGLEMYADKPGWNDSCNGLPGLFGSSINETIELLRLIKLFKEMLKDFNDDIELTKASFELLQNIYKLSGEGFTYWDKQHTYLEQFEDKYRLDTELVTVNKPTKYLDEFLKRIEKGIKSAKRMNDVIPTYFIHQVTDYKVVDNKVVVASFKTIPLPSFLEGPARLAKLGRSYFSVSDINAINKSDLLDKKLKIYKTSVPLDNASNEIGRIKSFNPGWLERESDFLHMTYKYLLGLLKAGQYRQFFKAAKNNLPCFMNPEIYARPIFENVSFIVPTNHVDASLHGSGHYARLTGANAEIINIYQLILFGEHIFEMKNNEVMFAMKPHIPVLLFKDGHVYASLFGMDVDIYNPNGKDYMDQNDVSYYLDDRQITTLTNELLDDIRNKKNHHKLVVEIH